MAVPLVDAIVEISADRSKLNATLGAVYTDAAKIPAIKVPVQVDSVSAGDLSSQVMAQMGGSGVSDAMKPFTKTVAVDFEFGSLRESISEFQKAVKGVQEAGLLDALTAAHDLLVTLGGAGKGLASTIGGVLSTSIGKLAGGLGAAVGVLQLFRQEGESTTETFQRLALNYVLFMKTAKQEEQSYQEMIAKRGDVVARSVGSDVKRDLAPGEAERIANIEKINKELATLQKERDDIAASFAGGFADNSQLPVLDRQIERLRLLRNMQEKARAEAMKEDAEGRAAAKADSDEREAAARRLRQFEMREELKAENAAAKQKRLADADQAQREVEQRMAADIAAKTAQAEREAQENARIEAKKKGLAAEAEAVAAGAEEMMARHEKERAAISGGVSGIAGTAAGFRDMLQDAMTRSYEESARVAERQRDEIAEYTKKGYEKLADIAARQTTLAWP